MLLSLHSLAAAFTQQTFDASRWRRFAFLPALAAWMAASYAAAYDLHFDYTSFGNGFGQSQFDILNYPSINGNYMMTSTDNHRPEMVANGNALAEFYNWLTDRYAEQTVKDGAAAADVINQYTISNSQNNGPRPDWIVLNEISPSLWSNNPGAPSLSTYRTWLIDLVTQLHDVHNYNVVTLAPFQNPAQNNASWQALAQKSYIGIECYLSGTEVWESGTTTAARFNWARDQYAASKQSYMNRGVPENKLFVIEHFANTDFTFINSQGEEQAVGWGRDGLASADDWDTVIQIRQDAILDVGFDGFLSYNWGGNGMNVPLEERLQHEYYYRTRRVLASQKPQWLSDAAITVNGTTYPLSWNQQLNWLGGIPNAAGAEVNFWRTLSANRTISLDGAKTAGTLTFDSPHSYTISAGTGGALVLNNAGNHATLTSSQGSHHITTRVQIVDGLNAAINTGTFTISGAVEGAGGLTKTGAGTLALTNSNSNDPNNYAGDTVVEAGTLSVNGRFLSNVGDVYLSSGAALRLNFGGFPDVVGSLFIDGVAQHPGIWGPIGSIAQYTTPLLTGTGRLQVTTGPPAGDFNDDGVIDAADYVLWRKKLDAPYTTTDYNDWRRNFGSPVNQGQSIQNAPALVPEPNSSCLLLIAAFAFLIYWPHVRTRLQTSDGFASGNRSLA
jgi:autotransporter-associated beta strand protein